MLKEFALRTPVALLVAAYWYAAFWLCFTVTGQDPIDIFTAENGGAGLIGSIAILTIAVLVFALVGRATTVWRLRGQANAGG